MELPYLNWTGSMSTRQLQQFASILIVGFSLFAPANAQASSLELFTLEDVQAGGSDFIAFNGTFVFDPTTETVSNVDIVFTSSQDAGLPAREEFAVLLDFSDMLNTRLTVEATDYGPGNYWDIQILFLNPLPSVGIDDTVIGGIISGDSERALYDYGYNDTGYAVGEPLTTPIPAALPLFATGLGGLSLLRWRRKRKNAAVVAA
jgi:hypothetical protein